MSVQNHYQNTRELCGLYASCLLLHVVAVSLQLTDSRQSVSDERIPASTSARTIVITKQLEQPELPT